ncbi:hypothetical protein VFDL14_01745 [Vibrio fortis]|uniref:Uncharacterized protein n=1 Tax=Vibrio fortis TaxID=212667 RepID=A0A066UV20_9VIBR|nr:hypothetical protein [Vibrio fortis]KDN27994.1 hypothetical protein VFDL14_01745 [Vibrio fortis]
MAILNDKKETKGIVLPYKKIGAISGNKDGVQISILESAGREFDCLNGYPVQMSQEQSIALGTALTEVVYNFLKSEALIEGDDC